MLKLEFDKSGLPYLPIILLSLVLIDKALLMASKHVFSNSFIVRE